MTAQPTSPKGAGRLRSLLTGPTRWRVIGIALAFITLGGFAIWCMQATDELPDVPEPFDVAEARRPIELPDADNAFIAYAAAHRLLDSPPNNQVDLDRFNLLLNAVLDGHARPLTWSSSSPGIRAYLLAKQPALELWRQGSQRRDGLYYQPDQISIGSVITLVPDAAVLSGMAALEGSRLEDAGDREGAWKWHHAILRSSRLIGRHGLLLQRVHGAKIHALATRCILRWAADPRVDARLLRQALHDTLDADSLTPPVSESIKIEYLSCLKCFENMNSYEAAMLYLGWRAPLLGGKEESLVDRLVPWPRVRIPFERLRLRARNEAVRSRRAFRLLCANWLAQVERPAVDRAPLAFRRPIWIYANDPSAPLAARAVSPERLARAIDRLEIARIFFRPGNDDPTDPPWDGNGELVRERWRRSVLTVRLAAELYRREHGAFPARAGDLLGEDLRELPEGIAADDPIPAGPE